MTAPYPDFAGHPPACADDPDLFHPHGGANPSNAAARALCRACPHRRPCLEYALANDVSGIWGGTTGKERLQIRKRRGQWLGQRTPAQQAAFAAASNAGRAKRWGGT